MIGITIPRFCDHPLLDPIGACRQCLVDIEGQRKPLASCTTVCTEGMVVKTQFTSPVADKAQHGVMELLLDQPPARLPDVRQGRRVPAAEPGDVQRPGRVPVPRAQAGVRQAGADLDRGAARPRALHLLHPLRADLEEIAGDDFIEFLERGPRAVHRHRGGKPFNSYFSGNTVQVCPVGALTGAAYRFKSRPFDLVSTPSVCEHCASGCHQRTDHRRGTRAAPPGRRRAAGQRGVELRQGPAGRSPTRPSPTG